MSGDNPLFEQKPQITISSDGKFIEVIGHYANARKCAKLTMLCEQYGAVILKDGYAKVPYDISFLHDVDKYINDRAHFFGGLTLLGLLAAGLVGGAAHATRASDTAASRSRNSQMEEWLRNNYSWLTDDQIKAIIGQYGDQGGGFMDFSGIGNQTDWEGLQKLMDDIEKVHELYGDIPDRPSDSDLNRIQQEAYNEIDSENQRILDLYNQTFQNSENVLNRELVENAQMFGDYRNQLLTNEAMRQQAIAGSTRYELDRQQRNAITRGASAAQRLVANINTQLGLQAQSAQQALDTSNALAQNLLAHRQAQQGVRNAYLNAQNQYNQNVASNLQGQAERRYSYGQGRKQGAVDDYNYAYDTWNENISNSGLGSLGQGLYRSRYGRNRNNGI